MFKDANKYHPIRSPYLKTPRSNGRYISDDERERLNIIFSWRQYKIMHELFQLVLVPHFGRILYFTNRRAKLRSAEIKEDVVAFIIVVATGSKLDG